MRGRPLFQFLTWKSLVTEIREVYLFVSEKGLEKHCDLAWWATFPVSNMTIYSYRKSKKYISLFQRKDWKSILTLPGGRGSPIFPFLTWKSIVTGNPRIRYTCLRKHRKSIFDLAGKATSPVPNMTIYSYRKSEKSISLFQSGTRQATCPVPNLKVYSCGKFEKY